MDNTKEENNKEESAKLKHTDYVKLVFDHIRNYIMCGAIFSLSLFAEKDPRNSGVAVVLFILACALSLLNAMPVIIYFFKNCHFLSATSKRGHSIKFWASAGYLSIVIPLVYFAATKAVNEIVK